MRTADFELETGKLEEHGRTAPQHCMGKILLAAERPSRGSIFCKEWISPCPVDTRNWKNDRRCAEENSIGGRKMVQRGDSGLG